MPETPGSGVLCSMDGSQILKRHKSSQTSKDGLAWTLYSVHQNNYSRTGSSFLLQQDEFHLSASGEDTRLIHQYENDCYEEPFELITMSPEELETFIAIKPDEWDEAFTIDRITEDSVGLRRQKVLFICLVSLLSRRLESSIS